MNHASYFAALLAEVDRNHPNADLDRPTMNAEHLFDKIQELSPQNDHQR